MSRGLYKSVCSTYSFGKTRFLSFIFHLWLLIFSTAQLFEFNVFLKDLITLYDQGIYIINHVHFNYALI